MSSEILILQTAFLGDLFLSIPLLKRIRKNFPSSNLTLVCRAGCGSVFRELKLADTVLEVNKSQCEDYKDKIGSLKKQSFDIIFSPHYSFRSGFIVQLLKAKQKVGFREWWNFWIFNHSVKRNLLLPDALRQLQLLAFQDTEVNEMLKEYLSKRRQLKKINLDKLPEAGDPRLPVPELASMSVKQQVLNHADFKKTLEKFKVPQGSIFLAPGSVWGTKRWTPEGYREVAQHYARLQKSVYFIGSPQEHELCEEISKGISGAINLAGKTSLFELLILMTQASLLICNDSGSMHMGSAAELPTVSVFSPTVLEIGYQPWQNQAVVVENKELDCRPCGKHGPQVCPLGHHLCMKSISSTEVLKAAKKLHP